MEQFTVSLLSGLLGAIIGAWAAVRINSTNRRTAAVQHMLSIVYPIGFQSWWDPDEGRPELIFHERYAELWAGYAALKAALPRWRRTAFDHAWQEYMAIEYFNEIPNAEYSKIFQKGVHRTREDAVRRSSQFITYLRALL